MIKKDLIKVMVVDDHAIFRQGLIMSLKTMKNIKVVGEAENGAIFLMKLPVYEPDIVIMDIKMPEMNGILATSKALAINNKLKVLIMTMFEEYEYFKRAVDIGVSGFILKTADQAELESAISKIIGGSTYFSPRILKANDPSILSKSNNDKLTNREIEVLIEVCNGLSNQEISENLCISRRTVDGHRANLLDKTGSKNTVELVLYAIKNGLFRIE